jgi:hypothetical protein
MPLDFSCGLIASIPPCQRRVRLAPDSDRIAEIQNWYRRVKAGQALGAATKDSRPTCQAPALGRCALRLEPRDRHVADVVGSRDLDQRLTAASGRGFLLEGKIVRNVNARCGGGPSGLTQSI